MRTEGGAQGLAGRIQALIAEFDEVADAVEAVEDVEERAKLAHLLVEQAYALGRDMSLVRQDAVWVLRAPEGRDWPHSEVGRLLGIPTHSAARIANTPLKREARPGNE